MRSLAWNWPKRKKSTSKSSGNWPGSSKVRRRLKQAIEQERVDVVKHLFSLSPPGYETKSQHEQIEEIRADLRLIDQTITNVIETAARNESSISTLSSPSSSISTSLKRTASSEAGFMSKKVDFTFISVVLLGGNQCFLLLNFENNQLFYAEKMSLINF